MKFHRLVSLALSIALLQVASAFAQEQSSEVENAGNTPALSATDKQKASNGRVRLNLDLSDQDLSNLRSNGKLRLRIPEYYKNRVSAILLRHVDSYLQKKVRVRGEPIVENNVSQVRVDELMIERIRYQPIEYRVFEKNFTEVEIRFVDEPGTKVFVANENDGLTRDEYQIDILNRFQLTAKISKQAELMLDTSFGVHKIRWADVDRIEFGELGANSAKLFLRDGSAVSGRLEIETWDIKTRWGKIAIPADDLTSISR